MPGCLINNGTWLCEDGLLLAQFLELPKVLNYGICLKTRRDSDYRLRYLGS